MLRIVVLLKYPTSFSFNLSNTGKLASRTCWCSISWSTGCQTTPKRNGPSPVLWAGKVFFYLNPSPADVAEQFDLRFICGSLQRASSLSGVCLRNCGPLKARAFSFSMPWPAVLGLLLGKSLTDFMLQGKLSELQTAVTQPHKAGHCIKSVCGSVPSILCYCLRKFPGKCIAVIFPAQCKIHSTFSFWQPILLAGSVETVVFPTVRGQHPTIHLPFHPGWQPPGPLGESKWWTDLDSDEKQPQRKQLRNHILIKSLTRNPHWRCRCRSSHRYQEAHQNTTQKCDSSEQVLNQPGLQSMP